MNTQSIFLLDTSSGIPIYRQIIRSIESAILSGFLKKGEKLPTIRSLAIELKINPNTIAKAYAELEQRGTVTTQVGSGTYVSAQMPGEGVPERQELINDVLRCCIRDLKALGVSIQEIPGMIEQFKEAIDETV